MAVEIVSSYVLWLAILGEPKSILDYDRSTYGSMFKDADIVETPVNITTSTYHVLQEGEIPLISMGIPVDYVFKNRVSRYPALGILESYSRGSSEGVAIFFSSEHRTIDRSIKDNAELISNWRDEVRYVKGTHYIHTLQCGGSFTKFVSFTSRVDGDLQIIRRILTDVMGTSGHIGADIVDLWRTAVKAITESEDVRGQVSIHTGMKTSHFSNMSIYERREETLKHMGEFSKHVMHGTPGEDPPLYIVLRPLHELDEHYQVMEKNTLVERYMAELLQKYNDVDYTWHELRYLDDNRTKEMRPFIRKLSNVRDNLKVVFSDDASMYKNMNVRYLMSALDVYQDALDSTTENYLADFRRWYEKSDIDCENDFLTPTRGSLIVHENEVVKERTSSLTECKDLCVEDKRCRAVGYAENDEECFIYYRSTRSARILFPGGSTGVKTYDRICK